MRILVACEFSGKVREAFRSRGHDCWSCDLLPSENSQHHLQGDVLTVLNEGVHGIPSEWDMLIAHPPCTYLCNSGVRWLFMQESTDEDAQRMFERWNEMEAAHQLFMTLYGLPIPKIVIENPVPHKYAKLPKYDQTIQPYQFGDDASKRTCLWLKGVPKLSIPEEELWVKPRIIDGKKRWGNQTDSGQNKEPPAEDRGLKRSVTYDGIANAFVSNWG